MPTFRSALSALLLATSLAALPIVAPATAQKRAEPGWAEGLFPIPGVENLTGYMQMFGVVAYDHGEGPSLYVAGNFQLTGDRWTHGLARWDGDAWHEVGGGIDDAATSMLVFDDGSGPALYVGGSFRHAGGRPARVARWDGVRWESIDAGLQPDRSAGAFVVFDGGRGPALYAASVFTDPIGKYYSRIVSWDGQSWSPVSTPTDGGILDLAVFEDGSGPALHAGGFFSVAGDVEANRIAKWDGNRWFALGSGIGTPGQTSYVESLAVYDGGSGPALYAAGLFTSVEGKPAGFIARWDGRAWSTLDGGVNRSLESLVVYDDGRGPALFVGGHMYQAGGKPARFLARWDGRDWSAVGDNDIRGSGITSLSVADDGHGAALYVGGGFRSVDHTGAKNIARWDGEHWSALGQGIDGVVLALLPVDEGDEQALYVAGNFFSAGRQATTYVAKWNGRAWARVGDDLDGSVDTLIRFDDGHGRALYVGGGFDFAGSRTVNRIARWDGHAWSPLAAGFRHEQIPHDGHVLALCVFDDGSGPRLYAAGTFTHSGDLPVNGIARWDGQRWLPLGVGVRRENYQGYVRAMTVFKDGGGPALIVAGEFDFAGNLPVNNIAKWDGQRWLTLGDGVPGTRYVESLCVFDDGNGPTLYAGGSFEDRQRSERYWLAKWDGNTMVPADAGLRREDVIQEIRSLAVYDDGSGPSLYIGGAVYMQDGPWWSHNFAKWNGERWVAPGGRVYGWPQALAAFNDGYGPALYVGGGFSRLKNTISRALARWGPSIVMGDMNCDGSVDLADVDPFLIALLDIKAYRDQHPDCGWRRADVNDDGSLDATDVEPFIELLLG